jgi:hypothetical protein
VRRLTLLLAVVAVAVPAGGAEAQGPALSYVCRPDPANCGTWYRAPVTLKWVWDNAVAHRSGGDCLSWSERTFTADTPATRVTCEVTSDADPGSYTGRSATIRIDQTPPAIPGPGFARPPDYNGWFNSPVAFSFIGEDLTSGVQSCASGTYGGPDGAGVTIAGSCQDIAGNVANASFALNYDATPPRRPAVTAIPGNHRVALRWSSSAVSDVEVVRLRKARPPKLIYRGSKRKAADRRLRNGRRYRYVVSAIDQAGNRNAVRASAVPTKARLLVPANGAHVRRPPLLIWKPVRRARYYNAQLFFRGRKVMTRWPRTARLQLHKRWRFNGRRHRLARGHYCWYVWPGRGSRSQRRYGRLLGKSCFTVTR